MSGTDELDQFLASVERRAFRMAEMAVGDREEALDLVQEAMLKLAEKYRRKPAEEWGALFYRILQSKIRDWYRRQAVKNRVWFRRSADYSDGTKSDPIHSFADPNASDPSLAPQSEAFAPALEKALAALPHRQRQVFLLRVWEGFDVRQTAKVMGCREGSVKTHFFRAVQSLRAALADFR